MKNDDNFMLFRLLYSLLLACAAPFLLYSLYKKKPGKPQIGARWREHFGITPKINAVAPIWLHTVSVGESIAAIPVIKALKQAYPNKTIIVTTTTTTGAEQIAKLGNLVEHRYMPIDFSCCVQRFINTIEPCALLIMETELWPNTLATVAKANIPITVINARLSERSAHRYQQFSWLFAHIGPYLNHVLCLHQDDANRFIQLGIDRDKVAVTGSVKFDIEIHPQVRQQAQQLRQLLGMERPIWIAASTHKGEDEQLLDAFKTIKQNIPNALLILVPRHPERFDSVFTLCQQYGFVTQRRTQDHNGLLNSDVYLGDTMGEMLTLMGAADVVFMAGSLIGDAVGGHNMLEPAALAKPILTGPSFYNFTDITEQLEQANGLIICQNSEEISHNICQLLSQKALQQQMGQAALHVVKSNQGAVAKTVAAIAPYCH